MFKAINSYGQELPVYFLSIIYLIFQIFCISSKVVGRALQEEIFPLNTDRLLFRMPPNFPGLALFYCSGLWGIIKNGVSPTKQRSTEMIQ